MKRILLIDDDLVTLSAVGKALERLDYEVSRCSDSSQGVDLAIRRAWDLVILDMGLPSPKPDLVHAFDGLKLLHWMRISKTNTPVIVFTGSQEYELEKKARAAGAAAVVRKGDSAAKLIETVRLALEPCLLDSLPPPANVPKAKREKSSTLGLGPLINWFRHPLRSRATRPALSVPQTVCR